MSASKQSRVIAAVRTGAEFDNALNSNVAIIFYLTPDLHTIGDMVKKAHEKR